MDKQKNAQQNNVPRVPIVCVMGHVDHGKSTLLDFIRKTNIVDKEAGGITQKIGAYKFLHEKVTGDKKFITFLDTPGHEAFGAIRKRGANVADIAILIVSAEDGVKPQTLDAYSCIKNSKLPFVVAITKIDKPSADVERTKQSLAENAIYLEGYGGDIPWAPISSKTGEGIPELLDLIDLVAEMNELSGNPQKEASGFIVESNHDNKRGPTATVVIKDGTLKVGDSIVSGSSFSHVKIMEDDHGKNIKEAEMGSPIKIIGWSKMPEAGLAFKTATSKKDAEKEAEQNLNSEKIANIAPQKIKKISE
jgi:translation initiation factor IF-2